MGDCNVVTCCTKSQAVKLYGLFFLESIRKVIKCLFKIDFPKIMGTTVCKGAPAHLLIPEVVVHIV